MKLAFTTLGCPSWTLRQIVENAARMGYDGVDFRGLREHIDITGLPEFTTNVKETKRLFENHGVAISAIYTSARFAVVDPDAKREQFDEARRNIELAATMNAPFVRIYGGRIPEGHTADTIMPYVIENLKEIAQGADQHGVTLVVETHDDWIDSTIFKRLMDDVNHSRVRALWDLHHPYRAAGEPIERTYANLAPYTELIHVKDSRLNPDGSYTYVLQGEGDVPLKKGLDLLRHGGYNGYATLEWEKRWHPELPDPEVAFPQYVEKMREWLR